MPRYRNEYDTARHFPDAQVRQPDGSVSDIVAEAGEEFDSEVELHNSLLRPVDPPGLSWNEATFRWEKPSEDSAVSAGNPPAAKAEEDNRE